MLKVDGLNVFYGSLQALWDVSLEVKEGEFVTLIGSNGAGKTTLLRTISGLLKPASGSITFNNKSLHNLSTDAICRHRVIQIPEGRELFPMMTVLENLEIGAYMPAVRKERTQSLERVYHLFPILKERRQQDAGTLSGGEQQMVAIGRGLMSNPALLMLDEPTLGLAPIWVEEILRTLRQLNKKEGMTILLVSQEVRQALTLADRAYVVENGHIVRQGPAEAMLEDESVKSAYLGL